VGVRVGLEGRGASMSSDDLALYVGLTWLRLVGAGVFCSGMLLTAVPLGGVRVLGAAALLIGLASWAVSIVWAGVAAHRVLVRRDPIHGPGVVKLSEETNRWTGSWYLEEAETVLTRPGLAAKVRRGWIGLMVGAVGGVLVVAIASAFT
jgi:hypothetical protein